MKKIFIITIALLASVLTYSQSMKIHKTNGSMESIPLNEIDSITFTTTGGEIPTEALITYYSLN